MALRTLLERITLRDDHDRLPEIDDELVTRAVRDFSVAHEKFGGGHYIASLTVRFKPEEVRQLLRVRDIPYAETVSRPVLVLPVYVADGSARLWDGPNPWFDAWAAQPPVEGLQPLTVPLGDLSDVTEISAEQAMAGDAERLRSIARKYGAFGTLVAVARLTADPRSGAPTIQVEMTRHTPTQDSRTLVRSFTGKKADDVGAILAEAVGILAAQAEEDWKRETLLQFQGQQRMQVSVPLRQLGDWVEIRRRLDSIATVKQVNIDHMSIQRAVLDLLYQGSPDQLRLAMAQSNLDLTFQQQEGAWMLQLRDTR